MERALIDSGPLTALFDRDHPFHGWAVTIIKETSAELITSIVSVHETLAELAFSRQSQLDFLTWIERGAVTVAPVTEEDITQLYEITRQPPSYPVDLADQNLTVLARKLDISTVITFGKRKR